jgi:hypothetical protein
MEKNNALLIKKGAKNELMEGEFWRGRARVMPVRQLSQAELEAAEEAEAAEAQATVMAAQKKLHLEQHAKQEASDQQEKDRIKQQIRNAAIPYSDVENALYKKWLAIPVKGRVEQRKEKEKKLAKVRNSMDVDAFRKIHYKGNYVKKRALIDNQAEVDHNKKAHFSYAERKWNWRGEDGVFESPALQEWYTVVDQTFITKEVAGAQLKAARDK